MYKLIAGLTIAVFLGGQTSHAQWGVGLHGGLSACPYPHGGAAGSVDDEDDVREAKKDLEVAQREMKKKKDELKRARDKFKSVEKGIDGRLKTDVARAVKDNLNGDSSVCGAGIGASAGVDKTPAQEEGKTAGSKPSWCSYFSSGTVNADICKDKSPNITISSGNTYTCGRSISDYKAALDRQNAAVGEFEKAEDDYKEARDRHKGIREEAKARLKDAEEDGTEAEYCATCKGGKKSKSNNSGLWADIFRTVVGASVAGYGIYRKSEDFKYATDQAARLGWPNNGYHTGGYGYPIQGYGGYGMMPGGMGPGGFGCAPTIGGAYGIGPNGMAGGTPYGMYGGVPGGAFGYPPGMYPPMAGGGAWNPGMGPGMGFPGGGPPMLPYPGPGGMNGMYPPGMGGGGMGGMYPPGMGGPGMGGMYPPGMGGGGMGGMYPPGMGGPGMGGMYPPGMGGPGMGGMYPPGMGGPGMGGQMGMPYQMQFMQQYMAQMQASMVAQQTAMQDYMYRQQTVFGLQQEMYRIQMQIAQISSGASYGMGPPVLPYPGPPMGGGGYGGGYPGGPVPTPYYGSPGVPNNMTPGTPYVPRGR
jgi:uncharacterized protein